MKPLLPSPLLFALLIPSLLVLGCAHRPTTGRLTTPDPAGPALDEAADAYVKLVLAVGRHDALYVDAYYGPPEWRSDAAVGDPRPVSELLATARGLLVKVRTAPESARRRFLEAQLVAVEGFLRRLSGQTLRFAEDARLLFDIDVPACGVERIESARAALGALLPGPGTLSERMTAVRATVEVPPDRLPAVVDRVLAESRRRTADHVMLPAGESFRVSYVKDKPWGAYNWYQGKGQSLIEVNTDLPMTIDRALGTLVHEGYPGHHVYNALLEDRLVRGRGWREFTVYPLYSPQSLIAEGTANAALDAIMGKDEQSAFIADVLAPIAGIDRGAAVRWLEIVKTTELLRCAGGEAARRLLEDGRPEADIEAFLVANGASPERARQNIRFYRTYRTYIYTYSVGQDLVEAWVGEGAGARERFFGLLDRPVVPSELDARRR